MCIYIYMVFPKNNGTPEWMVYFMENPMNKWMIWGYPDFWKHPYIHQETVEENEETRILSWRYDWNRLNQKAE